MSRLRKRIKRWVFDHVPFVGGRLTYFGATVYAPPGNYVIGLLLDGADGVYERRTVGHLVHAARPGSHVFDVGANIGLMALPVLYEHADVTVCSFEPSPSSTPFLERTVRESPYGARWRMFAKALGEKPGTAEFCMSDGVMGSFDGFCDTSRPEMSSVPRRTVEVPVSTLDSEWEELGRPDVSAIKIDVEGAEFGVLQGGASLIAACRPTLVMEWSRRNLPAYGVDLAELFRFAAAHSYLLFTADVGTPVRSEEELLFHMWSDEEFVLVPMARPEKA